MKEQDFAYADERFADLQLLRYRLAGFEQLTLQQKKYVYFLAQATLFGRDITTDQGGRWNLDIRKLLEAVYTNYGGDRTEPDFAALTLYLKRLWFSNGIYHHYGCEKFVPGFGEAWLHAAAERLPAVGVPRGYASWADVAVAVAPVVFDPALLPKRVNQADGEDLVQTSACNYYENLTQAEVEAYYARLKAGGDADCPPSYGLNSRLVKTADCRIEEHVYTIDGLYGPAIRQITEWLERAATVAENERQRQVIALLTDYYRTGDLRRFDDYSIAWLGEQQGQVDFVNGFIEVYGDPLGLKGSWEGIVEYKDMEATRRTQTIAQNAQWFEDHSPVDPRFRKEKVTGVTANVVCAAMLGGDEYPASAIGINLPNADWIRARHGSKSVTIGNLTEAYRQAARGNGFDEEFVIDEETRRLTAAYGDLCDDLHTDLHECLGHGSGRLLPGTDPDALKAYASTMEEARADLFGLYYLADPKLRELGLVPDDEAYKSQYYHYMMNGLLTQLVRIKPGHQIEEAHMRNRALIARWCLAQGDGTVQLVKRAGKTYVRINDYPRLRGLFARLLAEVQRIKSEGDHEAARRLVEQYGVRVDAGLHSEVLARYEHLHIAPYKGFINPRMRPVTDADGHITDIALDYSESFEHQMLRYSREYATL